MGTDLVVKRAYRSNSHVVLRAEAAGYAEIIDLDIEVLGVVIRIEKLPE